jgi:predicted transglutaminase-like protease
MSAEYANSFISCLVVGNNFDVDEFDNFTARVTSSKIPIFKNVEYPWSISFEINENNHIDRDPIYERQRKDFIYNELQLRPDCYIEINPDDPINGPIHIMINKVKQVLNIDE